jgi:glycosyltransferase involved in cell wall biosynthesis
MTIRISAVIPTFNRAGYLRKVISSLVEQTLPQDQYEIIVVDNCSTDDTKQVVAEFSHVTNLRYIFEPVQGLSQARNTGWQQSRGEYVAFTDDDAIVATDWLEQILYTFESVAPQAGCVGGRVEPIWEVPRPVWLADEYIELFAVLEKTSPQVLTKKEFVVGANIAFRKNTLETVGGFLPGLGRIGRKLLSNDETLIQMELERVNIPRYYNPEIKVKHHIPASRLTQKWMLRRMYWQGVSDALLEVHVNRLHMWQRARLGLHRLRRLICQTSTWRAFISSADLVEEFRAKCHALYKWGNIMGLLGFLNIKFDD